MPGIITMSARFKFISSTEFLILYIVNMFTLYFYDTYVVKELRYVYDFIPVLLEEYSPCN